MALSIQAIESKLNELLDFIKPVHSILDKHIVNFFTQKLWHNFMPSEIKRELNSHEILNQFTAQYRDMIVGAPAGGPAPQVWPCTHAFVTKARQLSFQHPGEVVRNLADFTTELQAMGCQCPSPFTLKGFMSSKKLHEVEAMGNLTAMLCRLKECPVVVDVGGGKGYLSSALSVHHGLHVIGLDSSTVTSCGAVKLKQKIGKYWTQERKRDAVTNYKQVMMYVTPRANISQLLSESFDGFDNSTCVGMSGLHTCGDLAPTCLRLFMNCPEVQCIVNVGCCYHQLTEHFEQHPFWQGLDPPIADSQPGFPLSKFLRDRKFVLGRNARMLGTHSLEKMIVTDTMQVPIQSVFYRAMLETVVRTSKGHTLREGQVGRLISKCPDFHEYMHRALKLMDLNSMTDDELSALHQTYEPQLLELKAYFLLRVTLAPLVEAIILLDRLLFLREEGYNQTHVVAMFDPVVSPRGYGVIAWK